MIKIAELESRRNVIVISTNERVDLDTSDPDVFMKRAFDYMMATNTGVPVETISPGSASLSIIFR